jgi:hypothetical protein
VLTNPPPHPRSIRHAPLFPTAADVLPRPPPPKLEICSFHDDWSSGTVASGARGAWELGAPDIADWGARAQGVPPLSGGWRGRSLAPPRCQGAGNVRGVGRRGLGVRGGGGQGSGAGTSGGGRWTWGGRGCWPAAASWDETGAAH